MMMDVFLCLTENVAKAAVSVWSERPPEAGKLGGTRSIILLSL